MAAAPRLTRTSLQAWGYQANLSADEQADRQRAMAAILNAAKQQGAAQHQDDETPIVTGILDLCRCDGLTGLPEGLHIEGDLLLGEVPGLTGLPKGLHVSGDLNLCGCPELTHLPERMHIGGDLDLSDCSALTRLPERMHIGGDLDVSYCESLTDLPQEMHVGRTFSLQGCSALTHLPSGIHIGDDLDLRDCTALTGLPERMHIRGNLNLSRCSALTDLPETLHVGGNLKLQDCIALTDLSAGMHVGGNLDLALCIALTGLPERLHVGGSLNLHGCTALTGLPERLHVGGDLHLSRCTLLTGLPPSVLAWPVMANGLCHDITLENTGISAATRRRMEAWLAQQDAAELGVQLSFSEPLTVARVGFRTLQEAQNFWRNLPTEATATGTESDAPAREPLPVVAFAADEEHTLLAFLSRLTGTADYKNPHTRPLLHERALGLIAGLQGPGRGAALAALAVSMDTCGDRLIRGLDEAEQALHLHALADVRDPATVRALGIDYLKLAVVRAHAERRVAGLVSVDEVEVYLAYETKLAQRLHLPVATRSMLYGSPVTHEDLERAAQAAQAAAQNSAGVQAYLQAWPPWQKMVRRTQAEALRWDALPAVAATGAHRDTVCVFTQEPLEALRQPVTLVGTGFVAELSGLMIWWQENGSHPVHKTPLELDLLRRLSGG